MAAPAGRRPTRRATILAAVAGAVAALASTTRTWITVVPAAGTPTSGTIEVAGSDAATGVAALAVVALAAGVAAAIAGRVARWVIAVLLAAAGVGIAASALAVLADPVGAAATAVGAAAGMPRVDGTYDTAAWPWLAAAAGAWLAGTAVVLAVAGRGWAASRKYDGGAAGAGTAGRDGSIDEIDGWDRLSRGEDPTG